MVRKNVEYVTKAYGGLNLIDKQLIKKKFISSNEYLKNISEVVKQYSLQEFKNNFSLQLQVERIFEVINQIMIDVCTHIVSTLSESPENYANCFNILERKNIIEDKLAGDLIRSVRMRNIIVHQYTGIDYEKLYSSIAKLTGDFSDFKTQILNWLTTI